ncbi:MAG TPA: Si-specific NAD(P)(+) transhydrogenase [Dehalococcoidia bacterium]|nr:Si-specific NAD(P)(+) transhydrogenase [Dehalococcoidia bacterium]
MTTYDYDLFVIGSGPAGQRAAIQAAKLGKRAAVAERRTSVGGVSINTGTIPSKTLREAVLYFSGYREHSLYGESYVVKPNAEMSDLLFRAENVIKHEIDVIRHQLTRNHIEVFPAEASFLDPHTLLLNNVEERGQRQVTAENIVIAVGSKPGMDNTAVYDGERVLQSDDILKMESLPRTMTVVGAGIIGCEYASVFAAIGVRVTLVDKRQRLLPFVDAEIVRELEHELSKNRVTLRLGEEVDRSELVESSQGPKVNMHLVSGKQIVSDKVLYSIGRIGATESLNLGAVGLAPVERGLLHVDAHFRTEVPHIFAVGDVIGFPSLAATSMEQGRLAACYAFGIEARTTPELFPFGIFTIPEISFVGRNEEELTAAGVPYETGKAHYREIARGKIIGDSSGLLKLIFHLETRELLGVHALGEGATELVHIGQAVMAFGGGVDYFVNNVFNYPTLAECYKTAAFDAINRLWAG